MKDHKPVGTWISTYDLAKLQHIAFKNKVTVAAYVRAIIIDAIAEESFVPNNSKQLNLQLASKSQVV